MADLGDAPDRVPGREVLAETGGHQKIAALDVGLDRHILQAQIGGIAGTAEDGPHAVAVDAHRHRMLTITDQHQAGRVLAELNHAAEHPSRIQYRLPEVEPVTRALVDEQDMAAGIGIDADDFGNQHLALQTLGSLHETAQTRIVAGQIGQLLHVRRQHQVLLTQALVVGAQLGAEAQAVTEFVPELAGPGNDHEDRLEQAVDGGAHGRGRRHALGVGDQQDQHQGQRGKQVQGLAPATQEKRFVNGDTPAKVALCLYTGAAAVTTASLLCTRKKAGDCRLFPHRQDQSWNSMS